MFGLFLGRCQGFLFRIVLDDGLLFLLGRLGLLARRRRRLGFLPRRRQFLLAHGHVADDLHEFGLIDTGLEPAHDVGKGFQKVLVAHEFKGIEEGGGNHNVGERDLVVDHVRLVVQMVVEHFQSGGQIGLGLFVTANNNNNNVMEEEEEVQDKKGMRNEAHKN
jgi:hypothetical protein